MLIIQDMDAEKLKALEIKKEARKRPLGGLLLILVGGLVILAGITYLAWPKPEDQQRLGGYVKTKSNLTANPLASRSLTQEMPSGVKLPNPADVVLTVSGYIINHERIEISPRFLGQVKWIGVKKGDTVTNGQTLVVLDDAEQQARLLEAKGTLAVAESAIAKAQLDFDRILRLRTSEVESKQMEDDARLRLDSAKAALIQAQGQAELMKTYLEWTIIRSPINGVVLEKLVQAGELVMPQSFGGPRGPSTALVALANPNDLQVEIDLSESDLSKVFPQQKCRVCPEAYPDKVYDGVVSEIAPEANRQKGTLQIKVQILHANQFLTPELSARVDFLAGQPVARP
jgi:HlyD family secretion protein